MSSLTASTAGSFICERATPTRLRQLPMVAERIAEVRAYRAASKRVSTQKMADYPTLVGVDERLNAHYLVIPNTSSERRAYIPIGWLGTNVIANQKLRILPEATLCDFALLTSAMHMAWMRTVTGRLESRYMYSVSVVYNTFPLPPVPAERLQQRLAPHGRRRPRRPRRPCRRNAGRPLRPRPHARQPPQGTSSTRPRRGPALPPQRLHLRPRARRASLRAVRENAGAPRCHGQAEAEAPDPWMSPSHRQTARSY